MVTVSANGVCFCQPSITVVAKARRLKARGDVSDDLVVDPDRRALDRRRPLHRQAEQAAVVVEVRGAKQGRAADEVGLVELHRPIHVDSARRRSPSRCPSRRSRGPSPVAGRTAPADPCGRTPEIAAGSHQRLPQLDRMRAWVVQLEAGFAGERQPQTWHGIPAMSVWTCCRNRGGSSRPTRCSSSPASGPVTLIAPSAKRAIEDAHVEIPRSRSSRGSTPRRTTRRRR